MDAFSDSSQKSFQPSTAPTDAQPDAKTGGSTSLNEAHSVIGLPLSRFPTWDSNGWRKGEIYFSMSNHGYGPRVLHASLQSRVADGKILFSSFKLSSLQQDNNNVIEMDYIEAMSLVDLIQDFFSNVTPYEE